MFSCEFCEIFKNNFFTKHLRATCSALGKPDLLLKTFAFEFDIVEKIIFSVEDFFSNVSKFMSTHYSPVFLTYTLWKH